MMSHDRLVVRLGWLPVHLAIRVVCHDGSGPQNKQAIGANGASSTSERMLSK